MSTEKTIALSTHFVREDRRVAAVIVTPGELVIIDSAGKVTPHATAAGLGAAVFVLENELAGEGIEVDIAVGDQVPIGYFQKGAFVNAFLKDGETIAIGDLLESDGAGALKALTAFAQSGTTPFAVTAEGHAIVIAEEALSPSGARGRIRVRVL